MSGWQLLFAGIIYLINFISILSIIFFRRKDVSVTFAWLMVLIFLPLIGFLLYFFFGSTYKLEVMTRKYRMAAIEEDYSRVLGRLIHAIEDDKLVFEDPETERYRDMVVMNSRNSMCFYTQDNRVELLVNGQAKFERMFAEIEGARETINVQYFIIKSRDDIGRRFIELLARKAAEGVKVRLIYDAFGCLKTKMRDFDPIVSAGGEVQRFLPSALRNIVEVNYRLHRKMVIIDGRAAYTGGINVGDDYLGLYPHITPWRDSSVRVEGSAARELQMRFFADWIFLEKQNPKIKEPVHQMDGSGFYKLYFPDLPPAGRAGVQIISCGPDSRYATHRDSYVKICSEARDYLFIQTPYFVPDATLMDAIRLAALSGVDVRLMLPGIPDKKYVYHVAMSYVEELLSAGIRVYTHRGFLHAKTFVIDDHVASVGTTNVDIRSFKLDYEVNTLVYDTEFAVTCRDTFLSDLKDCREIRLEEFKKREKWRHLVESVCRFITPLA